MAQDQIEARFQAGLSPDSRLGPWVAEQRKASLPVGLVTLSPHKDGKGHEMSYMFARSVWGMGLAYEAARAVMDHGLQAAGLPRVLAETQALNLRSCALLNRLGMVEMARLERYGAEQVLYTAHLGNDEGGQQ